MNESKDIDVLAVSAFRIINDYFDITLYRTINNNVIFRANPKLRKRGWKRELNNRLAVIGAGIKIHRDGEAYNITVFSLPKTIGRPPLLNILLFILTFLAVLVMAADRQVGSRLFDDPALLLKGMPFTLTLMTILLVHEMGHFWAGNRRGVRMSYPFFIPAPTFIGTFGAIIKSRTPIRNRKDLILIGAVGPLAGALPSAIALIWGLTHSTISIIPEVSYISFGHSLFTHLIYELMFSNLPDGAGILLSPIAMAGQVGLLITMLNLLPLGQLDGGHIFYGLFGKKQHKMAILFMACLFPIGFWWKGWWVWLILILIMKPFHPKLIEDSLPLDKTHKIIGWVSVVLFILTFTPRPIY